MTRFISKVIFSAGQQRSADYPGAGGRCRSPGDGGIHA